MRKFFERVFGTFLGILLATFFLYGEGAGIYHAFKKHDIGDGLIAVFIPPYAWYRSLEIWWHDDFAAVDWDQRVKSDARVLIALLNASANPDMERVFAPSSRYQRHFVSASSV